MLVCLKICLFLKMDYEQETKNILPTQKSFVYFSLPLILLSVVHQNFPSHFIKIFPHKTLWTPDRIGFALLKTSPCTVDLKLGFEFAQGFLDFQCSM